MKAYLIIRKSANVFINLFSMVCAYVHVRTYTYKLRTYINVAIAIDWMYIM